MEVFLNILDYIARTNLFNFIIFAGIIIFLYKKVNVGKKLDDAKGVVIENIEKSKTTKLESEENLAKIKESVSHVEEEIDQILKKAVENADMVGGKILEDAEKVVENIKDNSTKSVQARTSLLKNDILKRASVASIEVAKNHIINELNNNPDLHNKLIDESLEALNEVQV